VNIPDVRRQWTDFSQGTLASTGNATDLALSGSGFFAVESANGVLLTRNGNLRVSASGDLETSEGHKLRSTGGGTVRLDPKQSFTVGPDGTVSQGGRTVAQIEVVEVSDTTRLAKLPGGYFRVADVTATMRPARGVEVRQGQLESSNIAAPESAIRLVSVMRQFEMLQRAAGIGAEMNKRAVEDVARMGS
jgi:flagellar basal body rod protein FlgG